MQVEKKHYICNLLLIILLYFSFSPNSILNFHLIITILLNVYLFQAVFLKDLSLKFIITIGTIHEILSSSIIGIFYLKYLCIKYTMNFFQENFNISKSLKIFSIAAIAIIACTLIEMLIKYYFIFYINYIYNKIVIIYSIGLIVLFNNKENNNVMHDKEHLHK